jgi:peptide/nickel transport system substrate-binding protein
MRTVRISGVLIISVLVLMTGIGGSLFATGDSDSEVTKDTIRYGMSTAPTGVFNPPYINDNYDRQIAHVTYEKLVDLNPALEYVPELAVSWEVSSDSKTITFSLREGVLWHDGESFTAEDVKFTYEFIADPDYSGPLFSTIGAIRGIQDYKDGKASSISGIKVIDDYTISFTTSDISASFLYDVAGHFIIPEHIWSTVSALDAPNATELMRGAIGTGPYKMDTFEPDQYVSLVSNEDYWDGEPAIGRFIFQLINQETAQMQLLQNEIDFLDTSDLNPDTMKLYQDAGLQIQTTLMYNGAYQIIEVNNLDPLLSDKYVRQGLTTAIDREGIVENIMNGYATVADCNYPPTSWAYPDGLNKYTYSPDNAIDILVEKAGWEYRDGTMYAKGEPVVIELLYGGSNPIRAKIAPLVQEYFKAIGVTLELISMEFPALLALEESGDFQMCMVGNGGGVDPSAVANEMATGWGFNTSGYSNPEVDALFEEGAKYINIEDRKPIYNNIAKIINEDMPYLFLYHWDEAHVFDAELRGVETHNLGNFYNVHKWYFEN